MTPRVSVSEAFDDNVTFAKNNRKEDLVTNLSLGLDVAREDKTQNFTLSGEIREQLFDKDTNLNNTSENLTAGFQKELSAHDRFTLRDAFDHTQDVRSFDDEFGRTAGRFGYSVNRFDASYQRDITKQFGWELNYGNQAYQPSRSGSSDSYLNQITNQLNYILTSQTIVSLLHTYSVRQFSPGGSARTNTLAGAVRHYLTNQLSFDASAGVDLITSFNDDSSHSPFFAVSLNDDLDANSRASFSYIKQQTTNSFNQDIFDSWRTSVSFVRQILKRWALDLSAFYGEGEYTASHNSNKFTGTSIALSHDLKENVRGTLGYTYSSNISTVDADEYRRNYFFIALRMSF